VIGTPRAHFRRIDSTNLRARTLAEAGAPHGTLVTADEQSAGRGRQGRRWEAPPRSSLLMSVVVRDMGERLPFTPLATAVAVAEACESLGAGEAAVKWPNDVWLDGRKVAGILVEGRPQSGWAVIGVGLNVSVRPDQLPEELRATAATLGLTGPDALERALAAVLPRLEARLAAPPAKVVAALRERDALRGRRIRWAGGSGTARTIADSGALVVDTDDGVVELEAGEVHLAVE
jgi:BirA family biotin operon repressor/biotin-[acetyl-CoA-carboxylase] ligase